jgi:hypothetical protein
MTWIERLREWLASELLQPLAHHILTAHELNNQAMAAHAPNAKVRQLRQGLFPSARHTFSGGQECEA